MRLLLDEMLAPAIARQLVARGHDARAIADGAVMRGLSDWDVLVVARAERRAVVTNNIADFRPLHHTAITPGGPGHFGIVFVPSTFRRTRAEVGRLIIALDALLARHPGERSLADAEAWLGTA